MRDRYFPLLPFLFSLGLHGMMASLFLFFPKKILPEYPLAISVVWEAELSSEERRSKTNHKAEFWINTPHPPTRFAIGRPLPQGERCIRPMEQPLERRNEKENCAEKYLSPCGRGRTFAQQSCAKVRVRGTNTSGFLSKSPIKEREDGIPQIAGSLGKNSPALPTQGIKKSYRPLPPYPWICRKRRQEGEVSLWIQTNEKGQVIEVSIQKSSGHTTLDQTALKAVKEWRFADSSCQKVVSLSFRLER